MKKTETTAWDMADHIGTKEDAMAYPEAALEENDTALLLAVIGDIARSKGMSQIASELNLARKPFSSSFNTSFVIAILPLG